MTRFTPSALALATLVALAACSSNDDDTAADPSTGDPSTSGSGDSMLNPDLEPMPPSPEPSGNDTRAVAGLWDASAGEEGARDERYVLISEDGLWTDYDYRQDDLGDDGNCFTITPLRLDLETGPADAGTYSIADGRTVDLVGRAEARELSATFDADEDGTTVVVWPRVENRDAVDFEACDEG